MNALPENVRKDSFTHEEIDGLHANDLQAARIVVGLMTGVFTIGLLLYSIIFFIVW